MENAGAFSRDASGAATREWRSDRGCSLPDGWRSPCHHCGSPKWGRHSGCRLPRDIRRRRTISPLAPQTPNWCRPTCRSARPARIHGTPLYLPALPANGRREGMASPAHGCPRSPVQPELTQAQAQPASARTGRQRDEQEWLVFRWFITSPCFCFLSFLPFVVRDKGCNAANYNETAVCNLILAAFRQFASKHCKTASSLSGRMPETAQAAWQNSPTVWARPRARAFRSRCQHHRVNAHHSIM